MFVWLQHLNKTYKSNVPLVLMNSFNTNSDTERVLRKYKGFDVDIHTFNQSCYPRISRDSLLPIAKTCDVHEDIERLVQFISRFRFKIYLFIINIIVIEFSWYPPGHGDFYTSLEKSGLLDQFLKEVNFFEIQLNLYN